MIIRPMHSDDVARVTAIAAASGRAPRWTAETYKQALDPTTAPTRIAMVAEDPEAGVVGFLVAVLIHPQAELESIAVAESARRKGIARHLAARLISDLNARQVSELLLEVRASNQAALSFYGALGFLQNGRRTRYYSDPEEDAVLMVRSLI